MESPSLVTLGFTGRGLTECGKATRKAHNPAKAQKTSCHLESQSLPHHNFDYLPGPSYLNLSKAQDSTPTKRTSHNPRPTVVLTVTES